MVRAREFLARVGSELAQDIQEAATDAFHSDLVQSPISTVRKFVRSKIDEIWLPNVEFTDEQVKHAKIDKGGDYKQVLLVDGRPRQYTLHVPSDYKPTDALPLVIMLHGRGEDGNEFAAMTKMSGKADEEKFVVAYPDATEWLGAKWLTAWSTNNGLVPPGVKTDDVGFVKSIIDTTKAQVAIDPKRVYLAGYSNGGMLTYLAGSELSNDVAAIAVVSGAMSGKEKLPQSPVSVLDIHGTDDCLVPIDGRRVPDPIEKLGMPEFKPHSYAGQFWTKANGIDTAAMQERLGDVLRVQYKNIKNGTSVIQETIEGGNHYWPGESAKDPGKTITDEIWNFFQAHPKAAVISA